MTDQQPATRRSVNAVRAQLPSREDTALIESGLEMYKNSLTIGREFCKSMIESAIGALGIYYALYSFMLPESFRPKGDVLGVSPVNGMLLPVVAFLAAAIAGTVGFAPISNTMSLNLLRGRTELGALGIEEARNRTISKRRFWGQMSFGLFLLGLGLAALVIRAFAVEATQAPTSKITAQNAIVVSENAQVICGTLVSSADAGRVALVPNGQSEPMVLSAVREVHLVETCP